MFLMKGRKDNMRIQPPADCGMAAVPGWSRGVDDMIHAFHKKSLQFGEKSNIMNLYSDVNDFVR